MSHQGRQPRRKVYLSVSFDEHLSPQQKRVKEQIRTFLDSQDIDAQEFYKSGEWGGPLG